MTSVSGAHSAPNALGRDDGRAQNRAILHDRSSAGPSGGEERFVLGPVRSGCPYESHGQNSMIRVRALAPEHAGARVAHTRQSIFALSILPAGFYIELMTLQIGRRKWLAVLAALVLSGCASADRVRIVKVLPQYLDVQGRNSRTPTLLDRDVYQAQLRKMPERCSGLQFAVRWCAGRIRHPLTLRVELIGLSESNQPVSLAIDQTVRPRGGAYLGCWDRVSFSGEQFRSLGSLTAWRVSLYSDGQLLAQEQSFLW